MTVTNRGTQPLALGEQAIAAGGSATVPDDELSQRFGARADVAIATAAPVWRVVRTAAGTGSPPTVIAPGHRRRDVLVGAEDGSVALYYSTSGRRLLAERWSDAPVAALALDPKGDGAVAIAGGELLRRSIANPHPEVSLRTLFLPVHYEGYAAAKWVWQIDRRERRLRAEAEPVAADLRHPQGDPLRPALLGAAGADGRGLRVPARAGLAAGDHQADPRDDGGRAVGGGRLPCRPLARAAARGGAARGDRRGRGAAARRAGGARVWRIAPAPLRRRIPAGGELVVLAISAAGVVAAAVLLTGAVESALFGGDFQRFLFTEWGIRYDQRNSIVVGIALGFAVIPVIFTIAEDACSAVPRSLISASRALGATRWQTAVRLVVPAASPGLFAAVMLGLGRAVGETMIVLMAAGNTPLLDGSPFNGMRTMSAAIAVEIPEAPVASTLFRVLFLTGTLLFVFTLVVTTAADLVGSYLRKRYARF